MFVAAAVYPLFVAASQVLAAVGLGVLVVETSTVCLPRVKLVNHEAEDPKTAGATGVSTFWLRSRLPPSGRQQSPCMKLKTSLCPTVVVQLRLPACLVLRLAASLFPLFLHWRGARASRLSP